MGNALKFTEPGGKVMLRAYQLSNCHDDARAMDCIRVEISDTGIGIALEDQQAIFDRFFRVENRVHTLEGTGLGLSIVKNIIEKHNSQVRLVSEVGIGTTFWFDLMLNPPDHSSVLAHGQTDASGKQGTEAESPVTITLEPVIAATLDPPSLS